MQRCREKEIDPNVSNKYTSGHQSWTTRKLLQFGWSGLLMTTTRRKTKTTIAALLIYSTLQISGQLAFANSGPPAAKVAIQQQLVGRLTTRNNRPVTVNGLSATTGAAITSGATIETKADESATVDLGPLGRLDISPSTKVVLTFDERGELKALVIFGCVILTANRNTRGEVATEKGIVGTTDPAVGGVVEMCLPPGAESPLVGSGVAAGAGAGGGAAGAGVVGGGGLFGIGIPATIAILTAGGLAALTPIFLQENPSPA